MRSPDLDRLALDNSFHGSPDLDARLRERGLDGVDVCGVTTSHCCKTSA